RFDLATLHQTSSLPSVLEARRAIRPSPRRTRPPATPPDREPERLEIKCGEDSHRHPALLAAAKHLRDPQGVCNANGAHSFVAAWDAGRQTLAIAGCSTDDKEGKCPKGQIALWSVREGALQKQWEGAVRTGVSQLALDLDRRQIVVTMCIRDASEKCTDSESIE